jgi:sarcosine oxidase
MVAYDVIIIGGGAAGASAFHHLAARGQRVLCLERETSPNATSSHHGLTRIIRLAYFEHPAYVPLLRRAYALWGELEAQAGTQLFHRTGILECGRPGEALVTGVTTSARQHDIAHRVLEAREVARAFPAFQLPGDFVGVHQADGGFLIPEASITAMVHLGRAAGGTFIERARVTAIEPRASHVEVVTADARYQAGRVIVAAGAWMPKLLPDLAHVLRPEKRVLGWFSPRDPSPFALGRFPVFLIQDDADYWYGFPLYGKPAFKIAHHQHGHIKVDADTLDRMDVTPADEAFIRPALSRFLPAADGAMVDHAVCIYTMTPDEHFVIDTWPQDDRVLVASPCSGHGFKFATVTGEILADLAMHGTTRHDISLFRLGRFAQ